MVVENEVIPFFEWLLGGLLLLGAVVPALFALGLLIGFLIVSVRDGPAGGKLVKTFRGTAVS